MSLCVCSLHPSTRITDAVYSENNHALYVAQGSNLLIRDSQSKIITHSFFDKISALAVIHKEGSDMLVIIFQNSKVCIFDVTDNKVNILQKGKANTAVGDECKQIITASQNLLVIHNRTRTLVVYTLDENGLISNTYTSIIPVIKIFALTLVEDVLYVLAKDLTSSITISNYKLNSDSLEFIKSVIIDSNSDSPCMCVTSGNTVEIGADNKIFHVTDMEDIRILETTISQIKCMAKLSQTCVLIGDAVGGVHFTSVIGVDKMDKKLVDTSVTSKIVIFSDNYFLQISATGDSHVYHLDGREAQVSDSFISLCDTTQLLRSLFITKQGNVSFLENGCPTAEIYSADFNGGVSIWKAPKYFVISTYTKTFVFNLDLTLNEIIPIERDSKTLSFSFTDKAIQVTSHKIICGNAFYYFDREIESALTDGTNSLIVFKDQMIVFDNNVIEIARIPIDSEVSAFSLHNNFVAYSKWTDNSIFIYNLSTKQTFSHQVDGFVSSLFIDDYEKIYAITPDSILFIDDGKISRIHTSGSIPKRIKKVFGFPFICSESSILISPDRISFIQTPGIIDAVELDESHIVVLTSSGLSVLSVEDVYHTHISRHFYRGFSILCGASDEAGSNPLVFAGTNGGLVFLLSPMRDPIPLRSDETPKIMLWTRHNHAPFLCVVSSLLSRTQVSLFDAGLGLVGECQLSGSPNAAVAVEGSFVAISHSSSISVVRIGGDNSLSVSSTLESRSPCGSLTCPNSSFVVASERFSSAVLYSVDQGKIVEISRDLTQKRIIYSAAVSNTEIVAFDKRGFCFVLEVLESKLLTRAAFNIHTRIISILSTPPITFITDSGALCCILKSSSSVLELYNVMKYMCFDSTNDNMDSTRTVTINHQQVPSGTFVDGDLISAFPRLSQTQRAEIAKRARMTEEEAMSVANELCNQIEEYRTKIQHGFIL